MATIQIEQEIPSCRINKSTIQKILDLLNSQKEKIPEEEKKYVKPELEIIMRSSTRTITITNSKEFASQEIPRDLKNIRIEFRWYGKPEMNVELDIGLRVWEESEIRISGTDSLWVNGMTGQLLDIFKHEPTRNHTFQKNKTKLPILFGITSLFGFAFYTVFPKTEVIDPETVGFFDIIPVGVIGGSMAIGFFLVLLLPWLFPRIEFENVGIQKNTRRVLFSLIFTVLAGIFTTAIYSHFFN